MGWYSIITLMVNATVKGQPYYFPKSQSLTIGKINGLDCRIQIAKIKVQFNYYVLCNIYAPTQCHKLDQNNFILKFQNDLDPFANENVILVRDFKFYMNTKLDKMDSMSNRFDNLVYRGEVKSLLEYESH